MTDPTNKAPAEARAESGPRNSAESAATGSIVPDAASPRRSPAARGALFRIGRMLGGQSRDDRNGLLSRLTGRTIGNVSDLSDREALVIDRHLRNVAAQQRREREVS